MALHIPLVTPDDLRSFHAKHFPGAALPRDIVYGTTAPAEEEYYEEDDGLGYYPDGAKRTLTDEQIALFRHTEIQTILRERRRKREAEQEAKEQAAIVAAQQPKPEPAKEPTPPTITAAAPLPSADSSDQPLDDSMSISSASETTPPSIAAATPRPAQPESTTPRKDGPDRVQDGRIEKSQPWKNNSGRHKRANAKNRKANRKKRTEKRRQKREGSVTTGKTGDDDESDEWDPWHQATGPDAMKDTAVDLDY